MWLPKALNKIYIYIYKVTDFNLIKPKYQPINKIIFLSNEKKKKKKKKDREMFFYIIFTTNLKQ